MKERLSLVGYTLLFYLTAFPMFLLLIIGAILSVPGFIVWIIMGVNPGTELAFYGLNLPMEEIRSKSLHKDDPLNNSESEGN